MSSSTPSIPGNLVNAEYTKKLQNEVSQMLGSPEGKFPGAQPVSFVEKHIKQNLEVEDYYLCEKTDGIRLLLYLTVFGDTEVCYFINRKNEYYGLNTVHFPNNRKNFKTFHINTILDGELVYDINPDGTRKLKFLAFDCLIIENKLLTERPLDKRLAYLSENVYKPFVAFCQSNLEITSNFPFKLLLKEMEFSYSIPRIFDSVIPKLKHGSDGLIFTCRASKYVFGTDKKILKWKPLEENTIDFLIKLVFPTIHYPDDPDIVYYDYDSKPKILLFFLIENRKHQEYGTLNLTDEEWESLKQRNEPLDERIAECSYSAKDGTWHFMRFRDDKSSANYRDIVYNTLESITQAVSKERLIAAAPEIRAKWKERAELAKEKLKKEFLENENKEKNIGSHPQNPPNTNTLVSDSFKDDASIPAPGISTSLEKDNYFSYPAKDPSETPDEEDYSTD